MAPASAPDLFVKRGLFEFKEKPLKMEYIYHLDSVSITTISKDRININFYSKKSLEPKNPFKLKVSLEN